MLGKDQLPYVLSGVVLMTLQPILVTLSQNSEGKLDYNPIGSTLLSEVCKCVISTILLFSSGQQASVSFNPGELMRFSVPALIYFINNNLVFVILTHVNPTTFQLLSQLKTVFTGILFRIFLGKQLTAYQYLAIWTLTCGTATSHIPLCAGGDSAKETSFIGVAFSVLSCLLSAAGGIYSEKLLKDKAKDSIHWQNIQLYCCGCVFNLVGAAIHDPVSFSEGSMFTGYNKWAVAVVLNNAFNGLAISAILKYADNIARVYAHAAAMIVTMLISVALFGQEVTPQLAISVCIVGASAVQYNIPTLMPTEKGAYQPVCQEEQIELAKKVNSGGEGSPGHMTTPLGRIVGASAPARDD